MSIFRLGPDPDRLEDGLYEDVLSEALARCLDALSGSGARVDRTMLSGEDSTDHLGAAVSDAVRIAFAGMSGEHATERRVALANELLRLAARHAPEAFRPGETELRTELLRGIARPNALGHPEPRQAPRSPLRRSRLLVNSPSEPSLLHEILSEIPSADRIDLISAFVKWSGVSKVRTALARHCEAGRPLRVLTTVYLGATQARAVEELARLGAQVRVSYEDTPTRLHAKAWLFHRNTGLSTGYIGSSNLSRAAMTEGLEWNVRVARAELPELLDRFEAVFRTYWDDPTAGFVTFDPDQDGERLRCALSAAGRRGGDAPNRPRWLLDVEPKDFQRRILDDLDDARRLRDEHANLVVAATGTGKTVIAALDYRHLRKSPGAGIDTLLYVAHRKEILDRSLEVFRTVLREPAFGELLYQGEQARVGRQVFASIQTLGSVLETGRLALGSFDMVIVDEVHHAAAPTYRRLLDQVRPRELLGLTATPERMDDDPGQGLQLEEYFPKPWAAELRLWDAIEQQLLVPFSYFAVDDATDLRGVPWTRGRYQVRDLSNVYDANRVWVMKVADAVRRHVLEASEIRALAFCVDIRHAGLVAQELQRVLGVPCASLTSENTDDSRRDLLDRFRSNGPDRPRVLATVDLLNEGVDLPDVDTLLLLRPTESATLFLQQLGRGLRRAEGKDCLTVLDFVGVQHESFRFDVRYQALTGLRRGDLREAFERGFDRLPPGCSIELEEKPRRQILDSLRRSLRLDVAALARKLAAWSEFDPPLVRFLETEGLELDDIYHANRSYSDIRRLAGIDVPGPVNADEESALGAVQRLIHVDDRWRLDVLERLAADPARLGGPDFNEREARLVKMLLGILYGMGPVSDLERALHAFASHRALREELLQLTGALKRSAQVRPEPHLERLSPYVPLHLHARYLTEEIAAAFGLGYRPQAGVVPVGDHDLLLVTLDKATKRRAPHLQYRDYAISPRLFHWQSQAGTTRDSRAGRRHLDPAIVPVLFVRTSNKDDRGLGAPYVCLGTVERQDDSGERPISITYRLLDGDIPSGLLAETRVAVA